MKKQSISKFRLSRTDLISSTTLIEKICHPNFQFDFALLSDAQNKLLKEYVCRKSMREKIDFDQNQRRMISDIHKRIKTYLRRLNDLKRFESESNTLLLLFEFINKENNK